jgi:hypothetical protein
MRVVAPRSLEQTDMILLHRIRERRVRARKQFDQPTQSLRVVEQKGC